ncbi:MAG TPA: adenylyltransferase/cytidyltransferase family protein, partial [Spirochaetota bacterium]|nr:adenylyltransferase/cytidyltransferase family protein [Spirochaetota bacterium]
MNGDNQSDNRILSGSVRTGILGGAFNPPHKGHIALAHAAMEHFSLDRVVFVPSASPPHKMIKGGLSFDERTLLTEMAVYSAHPDDVKRYAERYADTSDDGFVPRLVS